MESNNISFKKRLKILLTIVSSFALIVFFQNCGQDGFQTKMLHQLDLASENQNDPLDLPNDDLPEITDDNEMQEITDIFNNPQNENNSEISIDNSASSFIPASSTGKVYYVSTSGSNSNTGTISKPFKTIAYAVSKMLAGDTTYVRGGIYNETLISFKQSGTQTKPIKLLNYSGESPIINYVKSASNKYPMIMIHHKDDNAKTGVRKAISYISIEGFEIRNGHVGIKWQHGSNLTFRRNWIHHNLGQGVLGTGGYRIVIDRNRINHNGDFAVCLAGGLTSIGTSTCNQSHGIYANGTYFTVTNNLIYNNLAMGITLAATKTVTSTSYPVKYPGPEFAGGKNWVITNNTFAYQVYRAAITLWGAADQVKIENNIFYQNCSKVPGQCANTQGINIGKDDSRITINNNLAYATGNGAKLFLDPTGAAVQGVNYTASNNIVNTLSPKFVNAPATLPSSPNFMLTASSPAINKGRATTATKVDIRGVARPRGSAYDIGAYEY